MAYFPLASLLYFSLILSILFVMNGINVEGREIPNTINNADKKEPEFLLGKILHAKAHHLLGKGHHLVGKSHDGSFLIPGLGKVLVPGYGGPVYTGSGGTGQGSTGSTGTGSYIPGGDDTLLPNPGVEVPNPAGSGIGAPPSLRP